MDFEFKYQLDAQPSNMSTIKEEFDYFMSMSALTPLKFTADTDFISFAGNGHDIVSLLKQQYFDVTGSGTTLYLTVKLSIASAEENTKALKQMIKDELEGMAEDAVATATGTIGLKKVKETADSIVKYGQKAVTTVNSVVYGKTMGNLNERFKVKIKQVPGKRDESLLMRVIRSSSFTSNDMAVHLIEAADEIAAAWRQKVSAELEAQGVSAPKKFKYQRVTDEDDQAVSSRIRDNQITTASGLFGVTLRSVSRDIVVKKNMYETFEDDGSE